MMMMQPVLNWIERRTGFVSMTKGFLTEDVPGGVSYWYVFGSATLFAMILQIATGIALTFWYAPSAATAWESTKAIYANGFEHFVLSMHYWGASAMIALVFLHLLQVAISGAYKAPRELQWVVGVILLLFTLVLGLTGYLLPWDMNAYFASQVSLNITGTAPIAGPAIQSIAQGGGVMGTQTINRFFGLHVWLMPILLLGLVGAHLAIFRHNGAAGPLIDDRRGMRVGRFWPDQVFMDTVVSFLVFILILFLSWIVPPFLDAKADPTNTTFVPYPAWYFLSLFGLLQVVPPKLDLVATIIVPSIFAIIVLLLPWIDRARTRLASDRKGMIAAIVIAVAVIVGLSTFSQVSIMHRQALAASAAVPQAAPTTTTAPVLTNSTTAIAGGAMQASSAAHGASVFSQNCSGCHGAQGQGMPGTFPPLANNPFVTGPAAAVINTVKNGRTGPLTVNGQTYNGTMPAWKSQLSTQDIADVITYIRTSLGSNKASPVSATEVAK
ncbi:MAG: cytochrome b N-terminal domain-containing protein [Candidatus Tyrphobacter sp.]